VDTKRPQEAGAFESHRRQTSDGRTGPATARETVSPAAPRGGTAPKRAPKRRISHVRAKDRRGVKRTLKQMTPEEMRRKGSWAVRFYGRSGPLPKLIDDQGRPTRFALTAAEWGEPVPKTVAAARRIAAKGHRLLTAYKRQQARRKR
jgi:Domain of unknown function (DUF6321)